MKTETKLSTGENVSIIETETEFVIEAQDWGIEGAFGARLEIGTAFASRKSALKAFEAVCKVIETEGEGEGETFPASLQTFCRAICEAFENFPPDTCLKVWQAFEAYQSESDPPSKEDLRDIYEALVTGLTLNETEGEGEAKGETETQYFLIGEGGESRRLTEDESVAQEFDTETEISVEVTKAEGEINAFRIEADQFFGSEGVCRLTVNFFPLETALKIFGETVKAFVKAESERPQI